MNWPWSVAGSIGNLPLLKPGRTRRTTSADPDWRNGQEDWTHVNPGQTLVLADVDGPGVITQIWNTVNTPEPGHPRLLRLRMYWDGEATPSVDCPLGDFFAGGHGLDVPVDSAMVRVTARGRARNCYWPMPFRKHARITLTNEGRHAAAMHFNVHWQQLPHVADDVAYFHAHYRQSFPAPAGANYTVADLVGRGHYVGTVIGFQTFTPGWFGEGDELFFIDGESEPSVIGTGTEDYFCDAWGFVQQSGPYYGTPLYEGIDQIDANRPGRCVCYRWHVPDPITFERSLRFDIEHVGVVRDAHGRIASHTAERADDISSVAFWYQLEPHAPHAGHDLSSGYDRLGYANAGIVDGASIRGPNVRHEAFTHTWGGGRTVPTVESTLAVWRPAHRGERLSIDLASPGLLSARLTVRQSPAGGAFAVLADGAPLGKTISTRAAAAGLAFHELDLPARDGRVTLSFEALAEDGELTIESLVPQIRPR